MPSGRPIGDHPSYRAAIIALAGQHLAPRAIAASLGIPLRYVQAVVYELAHGAPRDRSATRPTAVAGARGPSVELPRHVVQALRPHAASRDIPVIALALLVVEAVAEHGLVDAVLDDATRPEPAPRAAAPPRRPQPPSLPPAERTR